MSTFIPLTVHDVHSGPTLDYALQTSDLVHIYADELLWQQVAEGLPVVGTVADCIASWQAHGARPARLASTSSSSP